MKDYELCHRWYRISLCFLNLWISLWLSSEPHRCYRNVMFLCHWYSNFFLRSTNKCKIDNWHANSLFQYFLAGRNFSPVLFPELRSYFSLSGAKTTKSEAFKNGKINRKKAEKDNSLKKRKGTAKTYGNMSFSRLLGVLHPKLFSPKTNNLRFGSFQSGGENRADAFSPSIIFNYSMGKTD